MSKPAARAGKDLSVRLSGILRKFSVPAINWTPAEDSKPEKWTLVNVRCETQVGTTVESEGFWTGCAWRIIGYKQHRQNLRVTMWAPRAEGAET